MKKSSNHEMARNHIFLLGAGCLSSVCMDNNDNDGTMTQISRFSSR